MANYITTDTELTSVADAIRAKGGTSAPLAFPDGFVSAVEAIPTGGGWGGSVPAKEVKFRDYDGTIVHSYTPAEFAALTAMPDNPDHSHDAIPLTSQGWNWSFADAQAYVAKYGRLEVGQMYITTDGKTHIKIYIDPDTPANRMTFYLRWTQSVSNGVTVDWGDGSATQTYSGTSAANHDHTYAAGGWYDVNLTVTSGTVRFEGSSSTYSNSIYGSRDNNNTFARNRIREIRLGNGLTTDAIGEYIFWYCYSLSLITIPKGQTTIGQYAFAVCNNLSAVIIPDSVISILANAFQQMSTIKCISLPRSIMSLGNTTFSNDTAIPAVIIPDRVEQLPNNIFTNNYSLTTICIPENITSIGTNAFSGCYSVGEYHLFPTVPPTLNSGFATYNGCIIYVPYSADHSILDAYKSATNWSSYASHMQEEPQ